MSNIYEALELAFRQKQRDEMPKIRNTVLNSSNGYLNAEMSWLHNQFELIFENVKHRVVQFVGCNCGCGVSTIVQEFARVVVGKYGRTVLVLNANNIDVNESVSFDFNSKNNGLEIVDISEESDRSLFRLGGSDLVLAPTYYEPSSLKSCNSFKQLDCQWQSIVELFDYVIIDYSFEYNNIPDFSLLKKVDGVVLVVEYGKTKRRLAEAIKQKIVDTGGKFIGVVANKKINYIPKAIYDKL